MYVLVSISLEMLLEGRAHENSLARSQGAPNLELCGLRILSHMLWLLDYIKSTLTLVV